MNSVPIGPLPKADRTEALYSGSTEAWAVHEAALELEAAGESVIIVSIGDPDFDTPKPITDAAIESLRNGETHYSPAAGTTELRQAIAASESRRLGWTVPLESVVVTHGAQMGLFAVMQSIVNPGDEVLTIDPAYPTFPAVIGAAGGTPKRVPLARTDDGFGLDLGAAKAAVTDATRAFLFNFPHNPTGAVLTSEEAVAVVEFCRRHGIWLVCDEVYADIVFGSHVSPLTVAGARDVAITVRSLSKSHAMTGWRVGWTIAPIDHSTHILNAVNAMLFGGSEFLQHGAAVGLGLDLAAEACDTYRGRARVVVERIRACPHLQVVEPHAGIFVLVDVAATGLSDEEFAWRLLKEKAVSVLPAGSFSPLTEGFVRVALCRSDAELSQAADAIVALATELVADTRP